MHELRRALKRIPISRKKEILRSLAYGDMRRIGPERVYTSKFCGSTRPYTPNIFGKIAEEYGKWGVENALKSIEQSENEVNVTIIRMFTYSQKLAGVVPDGNFLEVDKEEIIKEANFYATFERMNKKLIENLIEMD